MNRKKTHILKNFDEDLAQLNVRMLNMAHSVEEQINFAIDSLEKSSNEIAEKTIRQDKKINRYEVEINELCFGVLAIYQPVASDLRIPLSVIKMSNDLERIGDEAEKLATATLVSIEDQYAAKPPLLKMARRVHEAYKEMIVVLETQDVTLAENLLAADLSLHQRYDKALIEVVKIIQSNPLSRRQILAYLWAIKGLERISDHIRNICQQLVYMKTGTFLGDNLQSDAIEKADPATKETD